jgi:hypothetical protein
MLIVGIGSGIRLDLAAIGLASSKRDRFPSSSPIWVNYSKLRNRRDSSHPTGTPIA